MNVIHKASKITLLFVMVSILTACSVSKQIPDGEYWLKESRIVTNQKEESDEFINNLLLQKPNATVLGYPFRAAFYNIYKPNRDSIYNLWLDKKPNRRARLEKLLSAKQVNRLGKSFFVAGLNNLYKKIGEPPIIYNKAKTKISQDKLKEHYKNLGFLDVSVSTVLDSINSKKIGVTYVVVTNKGFIIKSIQSEINNQVLDSLYQTSLPNTVLKTNEVFNTNTLSEERIRVAQYMINNGVLDFQENFIKYDAIYKDSLKTVDLIFKIAERNQQDATLKPFEQYTISKVNIFTQNLSDKEKTTDIVTYNDYTIYSDGKLNYRPKALTDAILIEKGQLYSNKNKTLTSKALSNLNTFNLPTIEYVKDTEDPLGNSLITNIILVPEETKKFDTSVDLTYSNIQDFGISGNASLTYKNLFKGAETLRIAVRGNVGSSADVANPRDVFFNLYEYGADLKLVFPRIWFPIKTQKFIKKEMQSSTAFNLAFTSQTNIGLDKENVSAGLTYQWAPSKENNFRVDLLNVQYVRNLNTANYFTVYQSSYDRLNNLASTYNSNVNYLNENGDLTSAGAVAFINDVVNGNTTLVTGSTDYASVRSIGERRLRLIEDNLIASSAITFNKSTKKVLTDNDYYSIKAKVESAGNLASLISNNNSERYTDTGEQTLFGVAYAQYFKTEFEYIKHWDLGYKNVVAVRAFSGMALPYGNAKSIPFLRSYFAGGTNDNRGWLAYALGPGRSGGINDFNEANFKLSFNAEYRFKMFGSLHGALFADAGNIWNIWDNVEDKDYIFSSLTSLKDIGVGAGYGLRYDFNYFVFRIDMGYKAYNPAYIEGERWLKDVKFSKTVFNFGINYPF